MGRLSKVKIDRIQKLRKKGYLQKEIAEMLGINIKTVRTYDPLRMTSKDRVKPVGEGEGHVLPTSFYSDIRSLADWISLLYLYVLNPNEIPCPHCLFPSLLSPESKSKKVMLRMLKKGDYKCPECGTTLVSPPNLSWRLLVAETAEELRREGLLPAKGETEG